MSNKTREVREHFNALSEDARALMAATAGVAGEKVAQARARLSANLEKGKEMYGTVRGKTIAGAEKLDTVVKDHPYQAIGIAFGIGAIIGMILRPERE